VLKDQISPEQVARLMAEAVQCIDPVSLELGLDLWSNGQVYNVVITKDKVQATVQDRLRYLVNINLGDFSLSWCSCPARVRCKHIGAAIYFLDDLHSDEFSLTAAKYIHDRSISAAQRKLREKSPLLPREDSGVEEWYRYFQNKYQEFGGNEQGRFSFFNGSFYKHFLNQLEKDVEEWSEPAKYFFIYHGILFVMLRMEECFARLEPYHGQYFWDYPEVLQNEYMDLLMETAGKLKSKNAPADFMIYYQHVGGVLRKIVFQEENRFFDWLLIYRILWSNHFYYLQLVQEEIRELDEAIAQEDMSGTVRYRQIVCRAHFEVMKGNDATAQKMIEKSDFLNPGDFFLYLHSLLKAPNISRLVYWLRWLSLRPTACSEKDLDYICAFWLEAGKEPAFQDEMLQALRSFLPRSIFFYRKGLIQAGKYKAWVDCHIFYQMYEKMDPQEIRRIESADVSLLLPLFHQFVSKLISRRNRESYRATIPLLKKLRKYYKKVKRAGEWDLYIAGLSAQNSRLRAFQEELRKGRLI